MARRGFAEVQRRQAAKKGALIQIYRGDQPPFYRIRTASDVQCIGELCPWLSIEDSNRSDAAAAARAAISAWLEVEPDRFDVEIVGVDG